MNDVCPAAGMQLLVSEVTPGHAGFIDL